MRQEHAPLSFFLGSMSSIRGGWLKHPPSQNLSYALTLEVYRICGKAVENTPPMIFSRRGSSKAETEAALEARYECSSYHNKDRPGFTGSRIIRVVPKHLEAVFN